jgi:hypothetical protein
MSKFEDYFVTGSDTELSDYTPIGSPVTQACDVLIKGGAKGVEVRIEQNGKDKTIILTATY